MDMNLQVGQTTQPRIPQNNHFPTIVICRVKAFDGSKLNESGLPETFFSPNPQNFSIQEISDLNQTWNLATMGIGSTLFATIVPRHQDTSRNKQGIIHTILNLSTTF